MHRLLSERPRSAVSTLVATATALFLLFLDGGLVRTTTADVFALALLTYLVPYLTITTYVFTTASPAQVHAWAAERPDRGTVLQRYVTGSAPGPGASIFVAGAALVVAVAWRPGYLASELGPVARAVVALALVVVCWVCVAVSFAVVYQADNLLERGQALEFPGEEGPAWSDYVYFALAVMTTFGTTDVTVRSREMRRTVTANAVIAFVFNTITVASLVSALTSF
ncbi:DUF1345 domain-containing protein [Kitasatospora sp. NPDC002227]|uniref:DUF1345 domain-containing protein n=1 Tax=Kitasatospora sp. NPDC002227 TaxID=3154773 RepID=UPI003326164F